MNEQSPAIKILSGLALCVTSVLAGISLGLLYVRLFVPPKAMGWDGIADVLGGMMVGALLGLVAGIVLIRAFKPKKQLQTSGLSLVIAGLIFAGLVFTAPEQESSPPPTIKKSFQPFFRISMRVSHTQEILNTVRENERPFPFTEAEISTSKPVLEFTGWGPEYSQCIATPGESDLRALIPLLENAKAQAGPYCRTPEDDLNLAASWNLDGESGSQGFQVGCLAEKPAFLTLANTIAEMANRLCSE